MHGYIYMEGNTFIHRLDPRPKLLMMLGVMLLAVAGAHPLYEVPIVLFTVLTIFAARSARALRRVRVLLQVLTIFCIVAWSFLAQGSTPLIGPVEWEAFLFGVGTAMKLGCIIVMAVTFLATTKNEEFAAALIKLRVPFPVAFAFSTALRLVPTFIGAGATIVQAQRARGLDVESGNIVQRMRKQVPLLIPVFASAIRNTNQLAMALESKGFAVRPTRTYYLALKLGPADWAVTALGSALVLLSFYIRFWAPHIGAIPGLFR
jgi:energy-coupling factor transport system permease protein